MDEIVKLWDHQKRGVANALENLHDKGEPHYAYLMEQGTGKTLTTITLMRAIFTEKRRPLKTLILCPAIVVKNWKKEIDAFSLLGKYVQVLQGSKEKRLKDLAEGERVGKYIFVTNIETLATVEGLLWENRTRGKSTTPVPIDRHWEMLIIDEAHRVKNPSAKTTKMAIKIGDKTYYKYLLTGTPIANDEMDIWSLFRVLDGGATFGKNFMAFKREWFYDANAGMPSQRYFPNWKIKPGSAERMSELMYRKALRVEKKDCLDLPPLVKKTIEVGMSPKQRKAYEEMKRDFITYLDGGACTAQLAIVKALRLQQIATGFVKLEDGREIVFPDAPRLKALEELLIDLRGQKVIVWASFKQNYAAIDDVCRKLELATAMITGEQSQKEKDQAELDFTKGTIPVLICNPAAGGTGVNLVEAGTAIWFSRSFRYLDRAQAMARNHRGGSEMHAKVTLIDILTEDTIDSHVLAALDRKEEIAGSILSWRDRC